ncbi:DNA topology modulation protein flar-related protein [Streptococcus sp. DD10]|uniref:DNA topology modulation protein n=1 Tax=Streptococcus sp. DD10 TaxID=1777878 RepID=UPI000797B32B|nr:DNA topology modulation protein [Streptococcus sp. DD10]KXT77038.1 DNA topology modulation protein flar-related protein [Streptococcus sp. DD10]
MKIAIIGYSGSGKSTLAQKLGYFYHIPVLHMDTIQFKEQWQTREQDAVKTDLKKFMTQSSWVIDGNYSFAYYQERMKEADIILFMDFPRYLSLFRAFKRFWKFRGKTRESMASGCIEKFDWDFILWILWKGRTRHYKLQYKSICQHYPEKTHIFRSQQDINSYLNSIKSL